MIERLISQLHMLANGNAQLFQPLAARLHNALLNSDRAFFNMLLSRALLSRECDAVYALDNLLNMFCTEALSPEESRQWRTLALTLVVEGPEQLEHAALDLADLRGILARSAGIPSRALRIDPYAISGRRAYDEGPIECFERCVWSKQWAQGRMPLQDAVLADADTLQGKPRWQELLVLVNIYARPEELMQMAAGWEDLAANKAGFTIPRGSATAMPAALDDVGGAWSLFNSSLHAAECHQVRLAVAAAADEAHREPENLQLVMACVEGCEDDDKALHVSLIDAQTRRLVSGHRFENLYEPSALSIKLDMLSEHSGLRAPHCVESTYFAAEVSAAGDPGPRFFVPAKGWILPDLTAERSMS